MLYNNPFTSGVDMSTELMLRIGKECENVTHIKESSGDIRKARDLVKTRRRCVSSILWI